MSRNATFIYYLFGCYLLSFKVYIVRVIDQDEVDGALGLMKLDAGLKQMNPGKLFYNSFQTCSHI